MGKTVAVTGVCAACVWVAVYVGVNAWWKRQAKARGLWIETRSSIGG